VGASVNASDFVAPDDVCVRMRVAPLPPGSGDRIGLSRSARTDRPVHGLRIAPTPGVSGWYVWSGDFSESDDFFEATHIDHIPEACALAAPFLSLPPGWRFLTDGLYVDVWFDTTLLHGGG